YRRVPFPPASTNASTRTCIRAYFCTARRVERYTGFLGAPEPVQNLTPRRWRRVEASGDSLQRSSLSAALPGISRNRTGDGSLRADRGARRSALPGAGAVSAQIRMARMAVGEADGEGRPTGTDHP